MTINVLPYPRHVDDDTLAGALLTNPLRVSVADALASAAAVFADDVARAVGWEVILVGPEDQAAVAISVDSSLPAEGFTLRADGTVVISASTVAGASYALTALRQLGPVALAGERVSLEEWPVPGIAIRDAPAFAWRGCHLDVSRHFFGVDTVLRMIDLLAEHRLNRLHLHLNDDQGWRVEIPEWPRLTSVGAFRAGSPIGHENDNVQDTVPHGGFFTATDIATIVAHAAKRSITVMPEIDLPGHAQAVLAAYPEFGNTDESLAVWTHWGISHHVLNVDEETLAFTESVVRYVASLFPGSPVHIGGDECPSDEWAASPAAQAVMASHGFSQPSQLQGLYTERLSRALQRDGHEVVAWDEVLDAHVPEGTIIAAWRSADKGVEAARRGYDTLLCPEQRVYLDVLSSADPTEPVAISPLPRVTTWETVYDFRVIPDDLEPEYHHHVRGSQAQLWTEYIATRDHLDYMAFPRLCAFAEVVWGTATTVDEFRPRLESHLERLAARGVRFRPLD